MGKGLSEDLVSELGPGVRYLGHVSDISAWLDTIRLTVAPLRFGAGAKGKIASSLACGVPCVATSLAVEGMELGNGRASYSPTRPRTLLTKSDSPIQMPSCGGSFPKQA